jgi:hypothetical protein
MGAYYDDERGRLSGRPFYIGTTLELQIEVPEGRQDYWINHLHIFVG